jgi:hypothetical protein
MPRIRYRKYRPAAESQAIIELANEILEDYSDQGFELTLRQLYYQFISRDYFPNTEKSYNNLGTIISRAREAGMLDWDHRAFRKPAPGRWELHCPAKSWWWRIRFEDEDEFTWGTLFSRTEDEVFRLLDTQHKTWYIEVYYWS